MASPKALTCGFLILLASIAAQGTAAQELTLDDYFAAALRQSEVIATQAELIKQAEERYKQAGAALLPTIDGIGSYTWIDSGARDTNAYPTRQPFARLALTQPLFRGFREIAALRQNEALVGAQNDEYLNARVQLFKDVVQNFFTVVSLEKDLINLDEQVRLNLQRDEELRARVRIGRSRVGEVLTVQSRISTLRAEIAQINAQLSVARDVFAFLSGLPVTTALRDSQTLPNGIDSVDDYLARLPLRPDVKASQQRLAAAQENVTVARGAHLPSLDLNANRYLERTGTLEDVDWDVQLALTIPLYAGGGTQSRVREAVSQKTQAELDVNRVQRLAEQEIRSFYQTVLLDRNQLRALATATQAAKENYEVQRRDYRFGLVTNLDVLQALTSYQENLRALDRARFTAKNNYLKLEAAAYRQPAMSPGGTP